MKAIERRLKALETRIQKMPGVFIIGQDNGWFLRVGSRKKYFDTRSEAEAAYQSIKTPDSVCIIWDI